MREFIYSENETRKRDKNEEGLRRNSVKSGLGKQFESWDYLKRGPLTIIYC
jgi:hypothetical protein